MEKHIVQYSLTLATAPVHIAPGGSLKFTLSGNGSNISQFLCSLREEIAYGMIDVRTLDNDSKRVEVVIYCGKADLTDFENVFSKTQAIECAHEALDENVNLMGLSMLARNQVIDCLMKL